MYGSGTFNSSESSCIVPTFEVVSTAVHAQDKVSLGDVADVPDGLTDIAVRTGRRPACDRVSAPYEAALDLSGSVVEGWLSQTDDTEVKNIGDTYGPDVPPNGVVALLGGAPTVAHTPTQLYAPDGDDGHPNGDAARGRVGPLTSVQFHAGHDADSEPPVSGPHAAPDGEGPRPHPRVAA